MKAVTLTEPAREIPIAYECDVCVIGGSTTGLFAAIAAARLGAKVAIVEALGYFGGTATASLVNVWHPMWNTRFDRQIVAGLPVQTMERLKRRGAVEERPNQLHWQWAFNPAEMVLELDEYVREQPNVRPFLHTRFCAPVTDPHDPKRVIAAIVEDKSGRRAIKASFFIDASGDGDLVHRAGFETYRNPRLQPPTTCALFAGLAELRRRNPKFSLPEIVFDQNRPEKLKRGFLWDAPITGDSGLRMVAGTRVHGADCSDADQLTQAEMEGRRQVRQIADILRKYADGGENVFVQALPARIGIRESRRARCLYQVNEREVLYGTRFDDAIANGSYCVDIHPADRGGITFRYLDGKETIVDGEFNRTAGRWRPEWTGPGEEPSFYQVPYRALVPKESKNVLVAGRCIDADEGAFGAIRVMINCSQMGEAAGTAAWLALDSNRSAPAVDSKKLRETLAKHGALVI